MVLCYNRKKNFTPTHEKDTTYMPRFDRDDSIAELLTLPTYRDKTIGKYLKQYVKNIENYAWDDSTELDNVLDFLHDFMHYMQDKTKRGR